MENILQSFWWEAHRVFRAFPSRFLFDAVIVCCVSCCFCKSGQIYDWYLKLRHGDFEHKEAVQLLPWGNQLQRAEDKESFDGSPDWEAPRAHELTSLPASTAAPKCSVASQPANGKSTHIKHPKCCSRQHFPSVSTRFSANPPICPDSRPQGANHDLHTGRKPISVLWPKASDPMQARWPQIT